MVAQLVTCTQAPETQALLAQSPLPEHFFPTAQPLQVPPPQSTSDSLPFLTLSVQVALVHSPLAQTPLTQSAAFEHF